MCDQITEAKGTIFPDENFRTGRRAREIHGEDGRKTKLRKRDRKSTPCLTSQYTLLSWGHTGTSWALRGAGRQWRGLRSVLAQLKILSWGGGTGGSQFAVFPPAIAKMVGNQA